MVNWKTYWTESPAAFEQDDFLRQVGHTVQGRPYTEAQFHGMISAIRKSLSLKTEDTLLDLCCGNGVITFALAKECTWVEAVDFSDTLIAIANKFHKSENTVYYVKDVLKLPESSLLRKSPFKKILMYGALQHFTHKELRVLLKNVLPHTVSDSTIFLGGVPDVEKKRLFYDTTTRLMDHYYRRLRGIDRMGTWWSKKYIEQVCAEMGLGCEFDDRTEGRPGGNYRFDVKICRLENC